MENSGKILTFYQKEVGDVSCVVWDASLVLARYLELKAGENPSWLKGSTVLELGSGVGCAGIVAACCGAHVTLSDLPEVLPLLEHNIASNCSVWCSANGSLKAQELDWNLRPPKGLCSPKILILADCIYYEESIQPLLNTMCAVTDNHCEILLCQEQRDSDRQKKIWESFMSEALKHFKFSAVPLREQHPLFRSSDIILMRGERLHKVT